MGESPVTGGFHHQTISDKKFGVSFDVSLNIRLNSIEYPMIWNATTRMWCEGKVTSDNCWSVTLRQDIICTNDCSPPVRTWMLLTYSKKYYRNRDIITVYNLLSFEQTR